ncbi:hypothetical protein TRAPUB_3589 [Trametes pubescens]|uniref:Uncharacterized protein n=1 Tax=Trametes pubescens TaxID=154538 RepID=A0A1M2VDE7_TRAPU|nr:hypothetical protein TRAPUB_3589 [Trametes pubescens]
MLNCFPGTTCRLLNGYDIVALPLGGRRCTRGNTNNVIRRMFCTDWIGNLLVFKRGRYDTSRTISISRTEMSLINALVHRCVGVVNAPICSLIRLSSWLELQYVNENEERPVGMSGDVSVSESGDESVSDSDDE